MHKIKYALFYDNHTHMENPDVDNPDMEKPHEENPAQINTNQVITQERNSSLSKYQSINLDGQHDLKKTSASVPI